MSIRWARACSRRISSWIARDGVQSRAKAQAYFIRWVAPDGTRKQLRGGKTIPEAQAVLDAIFDDEQREAGGQPVERLLHEFLADEHLPALMARLAPKVFLTRKSRLLAVAKLLGTKPRCDVRRIDADRVFVELTRRRYRVPGKRGQRRKRRERSPATLFQYKSALVVCWTAAIDAGFARENPWRGVKLRPASRLHRSRCCETAQGAGEFGGGNSSAPAVSSPSSSGRSGSSGS